MKKKVLAALLAVCMILSTCVLYASAAKISSGFVQKIDTNAGLKSSNMKALSGTAYNLELTVTEKSPVELAAGTKKVDVSNIDDVFDFKAGSDTLKFKGALENYFEITKGEITGDNISVTLQDKTANKNVYQVLKEFDTAANPAVDLALGTDIDQAKKYVLSDGSLNATVDKWTNKLCSLTMGVRFFGTKYDNLVASEIAVVEAEVTRVNGAAKTTTTSSITNSINDLMIEDKVVLNAHLKEDIEPGYPSNFYKFNCWVDESGNVISTDPILPVTIDGSSSTYIACFVETKSRVTIKYTAIGEGKVVYEEGREVFSGDAQISVFVDRAATFSFVPAEGYEVAHVKVDGKDVASFLTLAESLGTDSFLSSLKDLIAATDKDNYTYTFSAEKMNKMNGNHTIEVEFQKVKVLEEPSGKDLPTVAAEGITLATGADAENGDGENGGATTVPAEDGAAANGGSAASGVVNPATGSTGAIAVFATLSVAACAAFVTAKKKED